MLTNYNISFEKKLIVLEDDVSGVQVGDTKQIIV